MNFELFVRLDCPGEGEAETTDAEAMNQLASVVGGFVQVQTTQIQEKIH